MTDQMPEGLDHVRTTDTFDQDRHPAGLRRSHRVADNVWARLVVGTGALQFVFEDDAGHGDPVGAGDAVVIPPGRPHHIEITGPVTFAIEFHREAGRLPPKTGDESTGLH